MNLIDSHHLVLCFFVLIILMLLRSTVKRFRVNAQKKQQYDHALQLAKEAERKQQMQSVLPKSKIITTKTRIPTIDPFGTPFTGNIQGLAAKWEAEVHQLGRQIIGQIDSKMAALQALTADANRTANRLEILVEHLEQIARQQIESQRSQVPHDTDAPVVDSAENAIPTAESIPQAAPLADVLKELSEDIEGIHKTIRQSTTFSDQVEPAVVLRLAELQDQTPAMLLPADIRSQVGMLSNYGLEPEEISRRLDISLGEVDLILQASNK